MNYEVQKKIHEGVVEKQTYIYTLSLTLALDEGRRLTPRPNRFIPERERDTGTHCTGVTAGREGCRKSHPLTDSTLGPSRL